MPRIASPKSVSSLDEIRAAKPKMIYYSANTCWWTANGDDLYKGPVPLDPSGSPLFQTENVEGFLRDAEEHADHYGRHGLEAFLLAYHGNVVGDRGEPVCSSGWDKYNDLLDKEEGSEGAKSD